jgi:hypothetical protein
MTHAMHRKIGNSRQPQTLQSTTIERRGGWVQALLWGVVALTVVVLPCIVSPAGRDEFRAPKELFLRGSAVLIAGILVLGSTYPSARLRSDWAASKPQMLAATIALAWTVITTATSSNRLLSAWSLIYVAAAALFFVGSSLAVRERTWSAIYAFLLPSVVNIVVLILQEFRIWDLYPLAQPSNQSALIGNANDVGAYVLAPAVAAAVLCTATKARRVPHLVVAGLLAAGLVMTGSVTAIGSYAAAILALSALHSWKKTLAAVAVIAFVSAVAASSYDPLLQRVIRVRKAFETRDYNALSSYRLTAFVVAAHMFAKHPITGVGPGCYEWLYFDEKIAAEARHPMLNQSADRVYNFGQVHCDHLQTLAVSGLPGWVILLGSLTFLGSLSFRRGVGTTNDVRRVFARSYSLPLAVGVAVLMIAQFPLELAASTVSMLYGAALCTAWRPDASG